MQRNDKGLRIYNKKGNYRISIVLSIGKVVIREIITVIRKIVIGYLAYRDLLVISIGVGKEKSRVALILFIAVTVAVIANTRMVHFF